MLKVEKVETSQESVVKMRPKTVKIDNLTALIFERLCFTLFTHLSIDRFIEMLLKK